jgi:hypothetical protein
VGCVAEGFRAALARGGQSSREIAETKAVFEGCTADKLMQKACVKAVAGANRIYRFGLFRRVREDLSSATCNGTFLSTLHHDYRNAFGEHCERRKRIFAAGKAADFAFIGQEHIHPL